MDYTGTTIRTFKTRLNEIVTTLDTIFEGYPDTPEHEPTRSGINGVLSIINTLGYVLRQTHDPDTIAAGIDAFEQILIDLIEGRPDDDRNRAYKTALALLHGETP